MRKGLRRTGCGLLVMASAALVPPAVAQTAPRTAVASDPALGHRVDAIAAQALASRSTAGLAIGVARNGRPVLLRGYGYANLENRTPVTADTVFRIGSITKEFTAASVLLLAERGKLSADDPLAKYLPGFPRGGEVTLRQLLTHTSGIHNYTDLEDFLPAKAHLEMITAQMVDLIARQQPLYDFAPGTRYNYSNSGFFLLGAVIEKVSGQSYAAFVEANVLRPLGLSHTRPDVAAEVLPGRASGYDKAKDEPGGFANADYISTTAAAAAGAMRSTVGDLIRWHEALLGGKLLKPASVAMMLTPGRLKDGRVAGTATAGRADSERAYDYGVGVMIGRQHGRRMIGHGGAINGFNASLETYPDQQTTIVLLTNTGGGAYALSPVLADAVFGTAPSAP